MKKISVCFLLILPLISFAQKKENGKIYIEHPAINVVSAFTNAWVAGDTSAMAKMMTDDFLGYNPVTSQPYDKGSKKSGFLRSALMWHDQLDYFSVKNAGGSYPDAFEYAKDPSDNNAVTVDTWDMLKGVHKTTGVKADMYLHRSFTLTKDNKIRRLASYINPEVGNNIGQAMAERKNGTIYNEHQNINTLRKMIGAAENGDWDKFYSGFDPKATFYNGNNPEKAYSLDETKASDKALMEEYDIKSIQQVGYPDFLEYEIGNVSGKSGVLYSWWNFYLVRKSDNKEIKLPMHYAHDVNAEGKIINEMAYYDGSLFE